MKFIVLLIILLSYSIVFCQGDSGGIILNTDDAQESYILYSDRNNTYLIDNCGWVINQWPYGRNEIHLHPKLLEDGTLMFIEETITGYKLRIVSWDGVVLNTISDNVQNIFLHYEAIRLENGNYLTVAREQLTDAEFLELGYNISTTSPRLMDMVVELTPQGDIVWQWNIKDHIIQERDSNAPNYGVVADHPELLNMDVPLSSVDWNFSESFMINSFDYNPILDQIVISIRKMGEIAIIDHSTTSEEAAGHTGGKYGKGGDILWRWGNIENYGQGTEEDRFLYYQHNPNWITEGPYAGMMTCYNNGLDRPNVFFDERYSQVPVIDTDVNDDGSYSLVDGTYSPNGLEKVYGKTTTGTEFYSSYTSGAEFLSNGNVHITIGQEGKMIELNPDGEIVWEFDIVNDGYIYRSEKYPLDYPGFEGRDMTPGYQIDTDYSCQLFTAVTEISDDHQIQYEVSNNYLYVETDLPVKCTIIDMMGKTFSNINIEQRAQIDINDLPSGIFMAIFTAENRLTKTVKFLK